MAPPPLRHPTPRQNTSISDSHDRTTHARQREIRFVNAMLVRLNRRITHAGKREMSMAPLDTYKEADFKKLSESVVTSINSVVLYYLTTGRNAWHSTWVLRYQDRCMHYSLESAKASAERLRVQGTVFTIKQLPAICFGSDQGCLVASQINTDNPLQHYSADAVCVETPAHTKKIKGARDNYFELGAPMEGVALSFEFGSRFWRVRPPLRHSVFLVATNEPKSPIEPLGNKTLESMVSFSNGGAYLLGWSRRENSVSSKAVRSLVRQSR